jgi:chemotaxis protein MotB
MMRRKRSEEEHENLERWLVSYADFITLLFAFFVVMYSISSVNEGKYRVLSDSLTAAFSDPQKLPLVERAKDPIQVGDLKRGERGEPLPISPIVENPPSANSDPIDNRDGHADQAQLQDVASQIERVLAPYIQDDLIAVKREGSWIEIEMKSGFLFSSGRAELSLESIPMLDKLTEIFKTVSNSIHVEGHTDNMPINTREFPSNWELSSARAASVVHQLMKGGVEPARMAAIAYGEYHPLADNGTEEGRYKNRRVVIVLQSQAVARYKMPAEQPIGSIDSPPKSPLAVSTSKAAR